MDQIYSAPEVLKVFHALLLELDTLIVCQVQPERNRKDAKGNLFQSIGPLIDQMNPWLHAQDH